MAWLATACSPAPAVIAARPASAPRLQPCVVQDSAPASTNGVNAAPTAPGRYAADATWFTNGEAITIGLTRYTKSAQSRVFGASSLQPFGDYEYDGVPIYIEPGMRGTRHMPPVTYVPVRPGCEFQLYDRVFTQDDT